MITDALYRALGRYPFVQRQFKRVVLRLPNRWRNVEHFGQTIRINPTELAGFWLYYEREYDDFIFRFLEPRLATYQRALDIGAHYGIYSVFFGARMRRVDAFEPVPAIAGQLRHNLAANQISSVTIHESCVGDRSGNVSFCLPSKRNEGLGRFALPGEPALPLTGVSLDDFFGGCLEQSCIVKIDIEGGEWLLIKGAKKVWDHPRLPQALLIEVHPENIRDFGGRVSDFKVQLENLGWTVKGLTPAGLVPVVDGSSIRFWWAVSQ